jgi:hypothetical protein
MQDCIFRGIRGRGHVVPEKRGVKPAPVREIMLAAASIRQDLEDLQNNPRPAGKPSYDKGGSTLPGAGGEGW